MPQNPEDLTRETQLKNTTDGVSEDQDETIVSSPESLEGNEDATDAALGLLTALDTLTKEKNELKKALANKEDQLLRALADTQNAQKRMHDQVIKARDFAIEGLAKDLLAVVDSLEKASFTATQDAAGESHQAIEQHAAGVKMTLDLLLETLRKHHITQVEANTGQPFNHELHLAMSTIESEDMQPNAIVEVFQTGYAIQSRLLRAAMVSVAKKPE